MYSSLKEQQTFTIPAKRPPESGTGAANWQEFVTPDFRNHNCIMTFVRRSVGTRGPELGPSFNFKRRTYGEENLCGKFVVSDPGE
jgi:hypothetical protein